MPNLLDFVYFGKLEVDTDNAVALRHLASFFQCKLLRVAVNKFIEQDFTMDTALQYVQETYHYKDSALLKLAINKTAKLFKDIPVQSFTELSPDMLCEMVTSPEFFSEDEGKVSQFVAHYLPPTHPI